MSKNQKIKSNESTSDSPHSSTGGQIVNVGSTVVAVSFEVIKANKGASNDSPNDNTLITSIDDDNIGINKSPQNSLTEVGLENFNKKPMCSIFDNISNKRTTSSLSWEGLVSLAENPSNTAKEDSLCIASHLIDIKTQADVYKNNQMTVLWVDVDEGDKSIKELIEQLIILSIFKFVIYSTSTSMRLKTIKYNGVDQLQLCGRKWRILIPLLIPVSCERWIHLQTVLTKRFDGDVSAMKVYQILYAPNNPEINDDRETQHYEYYIENGKPFDAYNPPDVISKSIEQLKNEEEKEKEKAEKVVKSFIPKKHQG